MKLDVGPFRGSQTQAVSGCGHSRRRRRQSTAAGLFYQRVSVVNTPPGADCAVAHLPASQHLIVLATFPWCFPRSYGTVS